MKWYGWAAIAVGAVLFLGKKKVPATSGPAVGRSAAGGGAADFGEGPGYQDRQAAGGVQRVVTSNGLWDASFEDIEPGKTGVVLWSDGKRQVYSGTSGLPMSWTPVGFLT
jgi:hypothetical protein